MRKIIPEKNMYLASAAGAVFHNTGQILAACLIMRSSAVFFYYPFLIVSGIIAGLFTGFCAMFVIKRLKRC
ncbi:Gx transporter family protein [Ruminococcus sp. HUN007]|uniref:Gx transporter family protein n=1 Tax=Ruminococcus sp. HUN007 TaxID=1514668 RepID=UPI000ACBF05D|nr:Gx transporter family protein [Ruminococcus sp. HUN007]